MACYSVWKVGGNLGYAKLPLSPLSSRRNTTACPRQKCPFPWIWTPSNTWFLGPTWVSVHTASRSVKPFCTAHPCAQHVVVDTHTHIQTTFVWRYVCVTCNNLLCLVISIEPYTSNDYSQLQNNDNSTCHFSNNQVQSYHVYLKTAARFSFQTAPILCCINQSIMIFSVAQIVNYYWDHEIW